MIKVFQKIAAILMVGSLMLSALPAQAFEQLPRSLAWQLVGQSGETAYWDGQYTYGVHRAKAGDTVTMWATVKNLSRNPRGEVWYGRSSLLPEGPQYPNAHAIGVGTLDPMDNTPSWMDKSSFVINDNRFMYYDGSPVYKGQTVTFQWQIKIAANAPDGIYPLSLGLVREFDEWGFRVNANGANHHFQNMYWQFVIGNVALPQNNSSYHEETVTTSSGSFATQQVSVDLTNPKLKIFTETGVTANGQPAPWPVYSLGQYMNFDGADIGVNGSYFCPTEYDSCRGKENTFNPMVYNTRLGVMINETRNAGNLGGLLVFDTNNKPYFFLKTSDFKSKSWFESAYHVTLRAAIANVSTLVYNNVVNFGNGDLDSNMLNVRATRTAIGIKDNEARIVVVKNATVPHLAAVMQALGMQYALNLDGGGSTALNFLGSYKIGPGRQIANAIVFKVQ
jgi:hypothetical protein